MSANIPVTYNKKEVMELLIPMMMLAAERSALTNYLLYTSLAAVLYQIILKNTKQNDDHADKVNKAYLYLVKHNPAIIDMAENTNRSIDLGKAMLILDDAKAGEIEKLNEMCKLLENPKMIPWEKPKSETEAIYIETDEEEIDETRYTNKQLKIKAQQEREAAHQRELKRTHYRRKAAEYFPRAEKSIMWMGEKYDKLPSLKKKTAVKAKKASEGKTTKERAKRFVTDYVSNPAWETFVEPVKKRVAKVRGRSGSGSSSGSGSTSSSRGSNKSKRSTRGSR